MKTPEVSVVMTAYNGQRYLEQAARSLLGQDFDAFELIVVNDGSTDATAAILDRLAKADARVRVFHRENTGICAASNFGIEQSRAPLIARMDSDDVALPSRLGVQQAYLREHGLACVGSDIDYIDPKGRLLTTIRSPYDNDAIQAKLMEGHCCIWHTGSMYTRDAFDRAGGYDLDFDCSVDLDLWLRMAEVGPLGNVPNRLQQYRMHPASVSAQKRQRQRDLGREACERAAGRRGVACGFVADEDWRAGEDRASRHTYAIQFGWWAFNSGERSTAALYGLKSIGLKPWGEGGWRLLGCAMLKPCPANTTEPSV